jgi:hypothetical protein
VLKDIQDFIEDIKAKAAAEKEQIKAFSAKKVESVQ